MASTAKTEGNEPMSQPENPSPDESERLDPEDEQDSVEETPAQKPRYSKAKKLPGPGGSGAGGGALAGRGGAAAGGGGSRSGRSGSSGGFFTIYKKGQGYWTRMGTAIAATVLCGLTASFIYEQLNAGVRGLWPLGIGITVMAALMLICWWAMNAPGNADFLIATDSEMKKVNWTKPVDLMGSTKVVILFMVLIAIFLFVCDIVLQYIFHWCIPKLPAPF
jgi:preprotein translocase subunit SecE